MKLILKILGEKFYENSKFVKLLPVGSMPITSSVFGSNSAHIQIALDSHTNRLIISCAIDNLGKGAAGQLSLIHI